MKTHQGSSEISKVGVVQFGEGNFLRGFVDWMLQQLKDQAHFDGKVHVIQPIAKGRVKELNLAKAGYHTILQGIVDGEPVTNITRVDVVKSWINPYENTDVIKQLASVDDNRIVVSNTTESGIVFDPEDRFTLNPPNSFPGKLTQYLYYRFSLHSEKEVFVLPCELIDRNGDALKSCVLQYVKHWNLERSFHVWINTSVHFYNTLVDRIVPGYPKDSSDKAVKHVALNDVNTVVAEPYHLWVLQGPEKLETLLPFRSAGLNVVYTDSLKAYREVKVRILNGIHSALVPLGFNLDVKEVREAIMHPILGKFVDRLLNSEVIPGLLSDFPKDYLREYSDKILERLVNPFIIHSLWDIALNHFSKVQTRLFPTASDYFKLNGEIPPLCVFTIAATFYTYISPSFEPKEMDTSAAASWTLVRQAYARHENMETYLEDVRDSALIATPYIDTFDLLKPALLSCLRDIKSKGFENALSDLLKESVMTDQF